MTGGRAWFLLYRIRYAVRNGSVQCVSGATEVDDTSTGDRRGLAGSSRPLTQPTWLCGSGYCVALAGSPQCDRKQRWSLVPT